MSKVLIVVLFLLGFFAGLVGGLAWSFRMNVDELRQALTVIAREQARFQETLGNLIKKQVATEPELFEP